MNQRTRIDGRTQPASRKGSVMPHVDGQLPDGRTVSEVVAECLEDGHDCPTGFHDEPSRGCYRHGCDCDGCREGNARYMRRHRRRNPEVRAADRAQTDSYNAALTRLRDLHRDDFDRLYEQEKAKRGLVASSKQDQRESHHV